MGFACDPNAAQVQIEKYPKHDFLSKTVRDSSGFLFKKLLHLHSLPLALLRQVIRPEMCLPCGKRIRFGKMALKCRGCRIVSHPECKQKCSETCAPSASASAAHMVGNFSKVLPQIGEWQQLRSSLCSSGLTGGFCSPEPSQDSRARHRVRERDRKERLTGGEPGGVSLESSQSRLFVSAFSEASTEFLAASVRSRSCAIASWLVKRRSD